MLAHRLSTVLGADHIYVMKKGYIIEEGRHDELMSIKGAYYELYKENESA